MAGQGYGTRTGRKPRKYVPEGTNIKGRTPRFTHNGVRILRTDKTIRDRVMTKPGDLQDAPRTDSSILEDMLAAYASLKAVNEGRMPESKRQRIENRLENLYREWGSYVPEDAVWQLRLERGE
jgi:hypothetical protein